MGDNGGFITRYTTLFRRDTHSNNFSFSLNMRWLKSRTQSSKLTFLTKPTKNKPLKLKKKIHDLEYITMKKKFSYLVS